MTWQDVLDPDKGYIKDDSITLEVCVFWYSELRLTIICNPNYILMVFF